MCTKFIKRYECTLDIQVLCTLNFRLCYIAIVYDEQRFLKNEINPKTFNEKIE